MNILEYLSVNPQQGATLVSQLKNQLIWLIATGALQSGERLPSIRVMAAHLGIHHLTVRAAYQQLDAEGIIVTRPGSGSRVQAYDPQRLARMAGETRSHTVGVLLPTLANPFYQSVLEGIEESAADAGTLVFVVNTHDDPLALARYYARLVAKNVDGILVVSQEADWLERNANGLPVGNLPLVSLDCPADPGDRVLLDLEAAGWLATRHLIEHSHRRIGLITYTAQLDNIAPLEDGYRRALREAGLSVDKNLVVRVGGFDIQAGEAGARRLLGMEERPSAIFAITDLMAVGVLRIAQFFHLDIPRDLALVGFNDIPMAEQLCPPLTTVRAPAVELGRQGMRLLQMRIDGGGGAVKHTVLPVSLIIRQSCGCGVAKEERK